MTKENKSSVVHDWLWVWYHHSHPTTLERVKAIDAEMAKMAAEKKKAE